MVRGKERCRATRARMCPGLACCLSLLPAGPDEAPPLGTVRGSRGSAQSALGSFAGVCGDGRRGRAILLRSLSSRSGTTGARPPMHRFAPGCGKVVASAAPWRWNGSRAQGEEANRYRLASVAGRDQPRRVLARECSKRVASGRVEREKPPLKTDPRGGTAGRTGLIAGARLGQDSREPAGKYEETIGAVGCGVLGRSFGEETDDPAGEIGVECAFTRDYDLGQRSARGLERDAVAGSDRVPAVSRMKGRIVHTLDPQSWCGGPLPRHRRVRTGNSPSS